VNFASGALKISVAFGGNSNRDAILCENADVKGQPHSSTQSDKRTCGLELKWIFAVWCWAGWFLPPFAGGETNTLLAVKRSDGKQQAKWVGRQKNIADRNFCFCRCAPARAVKRMGWGKWFWKRLRRKS